MSVIEKAKQIDTLNVVEVPYRVWVLFGDQCKTILLSGSNQISLGEDYKSVDDIRKALDWYVEQFDGKVKWKK
jgi:hypothetical protein